MNGSRTIQASTGGGRPVGRFLDWWRGQLRGLFSAFLQSDARGTIDLLLVLIGDPATRLYRLQRGHSRLLGQFSAEAPAEIALAVRKALKGHPLVVLRLPAGLGLKRRLQLPITAERDLHQVVRYQLDTISPYPPQQIRFGCSIEGRDYGRGLLQVDIFMIRRQEVEQAMRRAEAWGLRPDQVDFTDEDELAPPRFNLLADESSPRRRTLPQRINRVLLWLCLLLGAGLIAVHLTQLATMESRLQARVEAARLRAEVATRLQERVRQLERETDVLEQAVEQRLPALEILDTLSRTLPQDTWLEALDIHGDQLVLSGFSAKAANLISEIENSPRFEQAGFRAPVVQDSRSGRERFQISTVVSGAEEQ